MPIFFLMYLGFIMYQQTVIRVVANDAATNIGSIYSTPSKEPFLGFTETTTLSNTKLYRNLYNSVGNLLDATNTVDSNNKTKANWYAQYRMVRNRLYKETGNISVTSKFERKSGTILQKNIAVKVEATYNLPFLKFFGIRDTQIHFSAVGRSSAHDLLDYASTLSLLNTVAADIISPLAEGVNTGVSDIVSIINTFKSKLA